MKRVIVLVLVLLAASCGKPQTPSDPPQRNRGLDLERLTFGEDPLALLEGRIDRSQNTETYLIREGYSEPFDYPNGYRLDRWNGDQSLYGKAYFSEKTDGIAHYRNFDFDRIAFLVHEDKVVAVLAQADTPSEKTYADLTRTLDRQFGKPTLEPQTNQDEFFEWVAADRYWQTDYYQGTEIVATSDQPLASRDVFTLQLLIFEKNAADALQKIQDENYRKTGTYKVMKGEFQLYRQDPNKNLEMMNEILARKFQ